jgi:hypothetical protein
MSKDAYFRARVSSLEFDGDTFYVRPMGGDQFKQFRELGDDEQLDGIVAMSFACLLCCCDKDGSRIFADEDREEVQRMPLPLMRAVSEAVMNVSGMGDDSGNA